MLYMIYICYICYIFYICYICYIFAIVAPPHASFGNPNPGLVPQRWQVSSEPLQEQFAAMSYDDEGKAWEQEADLRDVIQYVRGAKKLIIPDGWRPLLPTEI